MPVRSPDPPQPRSDPLGPSRRPDPMSPEIWQPLPGRPGFFRSSVTGRLKYDPFKDPAWGAQVGPQSHT